MPMSFFAVDLFTPSEKSFIKVEQYVHGKHPPDLTVAYIIKPGHFYFNVFKEQIELLWNNKNQDEKT